MREFLALTTMSLCFMILSRSKAVFSKKIGSPRHKLACHSSAIICLAFMLLARSAIAGQYTITNLGYLSGEAASAAWAINNAGLVAGSSGNRPFLWSNGSLQELPILPGRNAAGPRSINEAGDIVGYSYTLIGSTGSEVRATLWSQGQAVDLGVLAGQTTSSAWAINDTGKVVGYSGNRAASWNAGVVTDLGPGTARDINSTGSILLNNTVLMDSGTLALTEVAEANNHATVMNNNGVVAGYASGDRLVLWQNGLPTVLGQYGYVPSPSGINDNGEIVGGMRAGKAWRWTPEAGFAYLDDLGDFAGWELRSAYDINESGQIVGSGLFEGKTTAFLLTPVPEPGLATAALVVFSAVAALRVRANVARKRGRRLPHMAA